MSVALILITTSIVTLLALIRHLLRTSSNLDPHPYAASRTIEISRPTPHPHDTPSACTEPVQVKTIDAISIAVAEARFRRWGEEQGWSEYRMRSERAEFRERLFGKGRWEG